MVSLNDNEIKLLLENILKKSCKEANVASSKYKVILMGKKKKYSTMKSAYYVQVQNFSNTYNAKKSKNLVHLIVPLITLLGVEEASLIKKGTQAMRFNPPFLHNHSSGMLMVACVHLKKIFFPTVRR